MRYVVLDVEVKRGGKSPGLMEKHVQRPCGQNDTAEAPTGTKRFATFDKSHVCSY